MIVVTGAAGQLGTALRMRLGDDARYLTVDDLDVTAADVPERLLAYRPTLVINCAAYNAVDRAEEEPGVALAVNGTAVGVLAAASAAAGAGFVTFSSDYVFDGTSPEPYVESSPTSPANRYGIAKLAGEQAALAAHPDALVIRTSWVMSGTHPSFARTMLHLAERGGGAVVDDQRGHPTLVADLAAGTLAAIDAGATGLLHLTNQGVTTWFGLAREIVELAGGDPEVIQPCSTDEFPRPARRPANSVLDSERLAELGLEPLPHYREALAAAVAELTSPRA
jgi:dTDP-4-dehydrorhamnose reductase